MRDMFSTFLEGVATPFLYIGVFFMIWSEDGFMQAVEELWDELTNG